MLSYMTAQNFVRFRPFGPKLSIWAQVMGEKGGFWGKFPKTWEIFKFYHSDTSSNGMILKFCTGFLYGSERCVKKFCAVLIIFARITGGKGFLG